MNRLLTLLLLTFCGFDAIAQTASIAESDGLVSKTTDGGRTWIQVPRTDVRGEYRDTKGVLRTENTGRDWTFIPSQKSLIDIDVERIAQDFVLRDGVLRCNRPLAESWHAAVTDLNGRLVGTLSTRESTSLQVANALLFVTIFKDREPAKMILLHQAN